MRNLFKLWSKNRKPMITQKPIVRHSSTFKGLTELKLSELGQLVTDNWDDQLIEEYLDGHITKKKLTRILLMMERNKSRDKE